MSHLPLYANDVFVEWTTAEGGMGAAAFIDLNSEVYIGLYPLNRLGSPNGLPSWYKGDHLTAEVTVGFRGYMPFVVLVDVDVAERGISLWIVIPIGHICYQRHMFAKWGSTPPRYGFTACPVNSNWPVEPFPKEAT